MPGYLPHTPSEVREMLEVIGVPALENLFEAVPSDVVSFRPLDIPDGASEIEVLARLEALADKNTVFKTVFRGAGAYRHYIPAVVGSITSREEFLTSYTPYQPEISQGILQSIFEYQTMICELTGMDASNASVYDGASAAAEAAAMCRDRRRTKTLVSAGAHPDVSAAVKTYSHAADCDTEVVPLKNGITDTAALASMLDAGVASVYVAHPNFYGLLEPVEEIARIVHAAGAKLILGINPISAAILKTPAELGADVAVGEGQPLGMPLSFGGPYLGFMATGKDMIRKLPGRIVGETLDKDGNRAFVLTLQAREQHIRREKASSNICSNQALCAMTAAVYMDALGPDGLTQVACTCHSKAVYMAEKLADIPGVSLPFSGEFFHEFVTVCERREQLLSALESRGILGGYPLPELEGGILWCTTELCTKAEIDRAAEIIREVCTA